MNASNPFAFSDPVWLEEIPSTNDLLKHGLTGESRYGPGSVVATFRQTRGRGRMGNVWQSSMSGDLTFSFVVDGGGDMEKVCTLPLACGLGVRDFLALPRFGIESLCKWPNDVLVGGEKICGILTEGVSVSGEMMMIVGIGVNLRNNPGRDAALGRPTASLEKCLGRIERPEELLPSLLKVLGERIGRWLEGGFAAIRHDVEAGLWGVGRNVGARTATGRVSGVMVGLGDNGELLLEVPDGRRTLVSSVAALDNEW